MRRMAAVLAVFCPAVLICPLGEGLAVAPAAAQQQAQPRPSGPPPVDKFSVGSTIFQSFPPGKKKIDGVEFSLREKNATPGSCRVISVTTVSAPN